MRYFLTGATGFIGGRIARMLAEAGHEVVALVRTPAKASDLEALGVTITQGDITDKASMREPMTGVDGVFHVAAWYQVGVTNERAEQINVEGTRNVLELMRELAIPRGVYTSTLAVFSDTGGRVPDESYRHDGPHLSEYDRTKWEAHYEVAQPMIEEGLPLIILMPGMVYGPGDGGPLHTALAQYFQGELPMLPQGAAYCWAHVDDIARVHITAMEKGTPGETYIVGGERHTLIDVVQMAERLTGYPAPKLHMPPFMLKLSSLLMRPISALVTLPEMYHPEALRVLAGVTYLGDNSKARRELDYAPRPLEEGLPETVEDELARLGLESRRRARPSA